MKVFISWSGDRSKAVAEALAGWLPRVVTAVDPWISTRMDKGVRGFAQISEALESTEFGLVCLTRENLEHAWILFEAGALSKTKGARVWTVLLDIGHADVKPPLGQFQHTLTTREEMLHLVRTMNGVARELGERGFTDAMLDQQFEDLWPKLEAALRAVPASEGPGSPRRTDREMLEEMLEILRTQQRQADSAANADLAQIINLMRAHNRPETLIRFYDVQIRDSDAKSVRAAFVRAIRGDAILDVNPAGATDGGMSVFRVRSKLSPAARLATALSAFGVPVEDVTEAKVGILPPVPDDHTTSSGTYWPGT